jgi:hypothetical protein
MTCAAGEERDQRLLTPTDGTRPPPPWGTECIAS